MTAVDVSVTALDRASTHAATAGVEARIDFQQHDLAHTFPAGAFDLISAQYLQSPVEFPATVSFRLRPRPWRPAASC